MSIAAAGALLASPAFAGLGLESFGAAEVALGEQGILLYDYDSGHQTTFDSEDTWNEGTYANTYVSPTGALELAPLGDVGPSSDIAWWNDAWPSRQCVTINNTGEPDAERPLRVSVDTATLIENGWLGPDAADIRAVDSATGDELSYWIASPVPASATTIWVQLGAVPSGASSFCFYMGNEAAEPASDEFGVYTFSERMSRHYTLTDAFDGSEGTSGQVRVVSYSDGVIVSNGTVTTTLDKGESDTFSGMTQHSFVDASGPISATGLGDNTDALVPESFAATEFIFASDRNVQQFWVRSPDAPTTIEVVYDNAVVATHTVTPDQRSFPISLDAEAGKSVVLRSTNGQPFLAAHDADGADSIIGVPWIDQTLYGLRSTQMQIGTGVSGATVTTAGSDGGGATGVVYGPNVSVTVAAAGQASAVDEPNADEPNADSPASEPATDTTGTTEPATTEPDPTTAETEPEPQPQPQAEPATAGYAASADRPIVVSQLDDGTGDESTAFLPLAFLDSEYLAPASFTTATFVCPVAGSVVTMVEVDGSASSFTCGSAGVAGSPGLATTPTGQYQSGTRFSSTSAFFVKIDKLGTADDTNVLGPRIARVGGNPDLAAEVGLVEGTLPGTGSWSAIVDTTDAGVFGLLTALGDQPPGTHVTVTIAGASTAELASSFMTIGPDDTSATAFGLGTAMIPYAMDFDRFVAVNVTLETETDVGPSLSSLGLRHNLDLLDVDANATATVSRTSSPGGSSGFVARVLTNPGSPMSASIDYQASAGLSNADRLVISTDHPGTHVVVEGGVLTQVGGGTFAMDDQSPFSILYDEVTVAGANPSVTVRLQGEEPNGFTRSNDIVIVVDG